MRDLNRRASQAPLPFFFLALAVLVLAGNVVAQAPALAGLSVSLLMAGVLGWRGYQRCGRVPNYVIWWAFGVGLALVFQLGRLS